MAEQTFKKEVDYSEDKNNFVAENEITLTITLSEYRELVSVKAVKDKLVKEVEKDKWTREEENKKLKKENEELKAELYKMQKRIDEIQGNTCESEDE